jgi:hypothetical protein
VRPDELDAVLHVYEGLGLSDNMHEAYNQRHNFRYQGVEIALKWSVTWGHHAEFEVLLPEPQVPEQIDDASRLISRVAAELGVRLMTEQELSDFIAEFEAKRETP